MSRTFIRHPDGQSAIFFTAFGVATLALGLQYHVGSPGRMGPGFFPVYLGALLTLVGVIVGVLALSKTSDIVLPPIEWRALVTVTGAILVAAFLLLTAGLLVAIPALVVISAFAGRGFAPIPVALTAIALTFMAWVIFIWGLGLRIPVLGL